MSIMRKKGMKNKAVSNTLFIVFCIAILLFLLNAPKESTKKLPNDEQHTRFRAMKDRKEAEKYCGECHSPEGQAPLRKDHPPKYRCLFCHKTQ